MNKFLSIIIVFLLVISCATNEKQMNLSGNVKGLKKGTILLQKIEDTLLITVDSVTIKGNSTFSFSEIIEEPELYYLNVKLENGIIRDDRIAFFAESNEITINTTLKNFEVDAKVSGSKNQDKFIEYNKIIDRYSNQNLELIEKGYIARQNGEDSLALTIEKNQKNIVSKKYLATISYALNNNDYEIAPYLMVSHVNNSRLKYLDSVYNKLTPKIKDSKYGKALESLIQSRRKNEIN